MQKSCLFLVFSILFASCYCQDHWTFEGLWTDDVAEGGFGGNFSICVEGNKAWGLYSEVGIAFGTISDDGLTFEGTFHEGGIDNDCLEGPFSLSITENGTRYEGKWGCRQKLVYNWSGRRINTFKQSDHDCAKLMPFTSKSSLDGRWWRRTEDGSGSVDFCTSSNGEYEASSSIPSFTPQGYEEGKWESSRHVAHGVFYRSNDNGALPGRSLWFINSNGQLANIWWAGLDADNYNIRRIRDSSIHSYDLYQFARGTTVSVCSRFSALAKQPFDYYPYENQLFGFSEYTRQFPEFTLSSQSTVDVSTDFDTTVTNSLSTKTTYSGITTYYSGSSTLAYSFAILLITLLFC